MPLILEGLVTTLEPDGQVHLAPMGPIVDRDLSRLTIRPFVTSRTFANLQRERAGVFHVTDDVELLAGAAIHELPYEPEYESIPGFPVARLATACRWYAFRIQTGEETPPRAEFHCEVVERGTVREFWGFNRARHAVLEAAILATRVDLLAPEFLRAELDRLRVLVDKTGGDLETRAWQRVERHIVGRLGR